MSCIIRRSPPTQQHAPNFSSASSPCRRHDFGIIFYTQANMCTFYHYIYVVLHTRESEKKRDSHIKHLFSVSSSKCLPAIFGIYFISHIIHPCVVCDPCTTSTSAWMRNERK